MTTDDTALKNVRRAIAAVVCNVSNLPEPLQVPALGLHMGDLVDGLVDAVSPVLTGRRPSPTPLTDRLAAKENPRG